MRRRSRLLGPDGRELEPPTLLDVAREASDGSMLPIVEALARRNNLLEDKPWQARVSPILDASGRPYLREVEWVTVGSQ